MKKTILLIVLLITSIIVTTQNSITFHLGSTDITNLVPGDTVYVPIIFDFIGPSNIITGAQYTFGMDPAVINWTGNFTSDFGNTENWMFFYNGDELTAISGSGIASSDMTLISFEFIYAGGETNLDWIYSEVYDEDFDYFTLTVINGCICDLPDYDVTFHVTAEGEDLEGAIVTIGNLWLETDENGIAIFSLSDGQYSYTVTKEGYADEEGTLTVAGAPIQVVVEMEMCWDVTFQVIPADSTIIIINGDTLVPSPNGVASICLPDGVYLITVLNPGFYPFEGMLTINGASLTFEIILDPLFFDVTFFINCCGEPVPNYTFNYQGQTVITDATGLASLNLVAGFYSFEIGGVPVSFTVPDTTYVPVDICSEVTFHTTTDEGFNLEGVQIEINSETLITGETGNAGICLQSGNYDYTAFKAGFETQYGTIQVDTISQTIEIVMPPETWAVTFNCPAFCENDFNGWICQINGEILHSGETIFLGNGNWNTYISWLDCSGMMGQLIINNAAIDIECLGGLEHPVATFHILSPSGNLSGATVAVDTFSLITNNSGETGFCLPGGVHYYSISKEGYDTLTGSFNWSNYCQDTILNFLMNPVSTENYPANSFQLYPNPSEGLFYLSGDKQTTDPVEITITDVAGRVIYFGIEKIDKLIEIDLSNKNKGIYLIHLTSPQNNLIRKVILK